MIVVSTVAKEGAKETIKALELGAFDFVTKPENFIEAKGEDFKQRILDMLDIATAGSTKASVIGTMPVTQSINTRATSIRTFGSSKNDRSTPALAARPVQPLMTVKMGSTASYKRIMLTELLPWHVQQVVLNHFSRLFHIFRRN